MTGEIIRRWCATATRERVHAYVDLFRSVVRPALGRVPGFVGATVIVGELGDGSGNEIGDSDAATPVDIVVETRWRSMEAVRAFAGVDATVAVVEPAAAALLLAYDRVVRHYQVVDD